MVTLIVFPIGDWASRMYGTFKTLEELPANVKRHFPEKFPYFSELGFVEGDLRYYLRVERR